MPVTINASTSSGLIQSADTSGQIELQTNGTTVATVNTSNNVQFRSSISVGNATPTTSGAGITFPATQSASSDANTLDDYEEGTWTPALAFGTSGSVTYTERYGQYVKVGNTVFLTFWIYGAGRSSPTGDTSITGMPFTSGSIQTRPATFLRTNQLTMTGYVVAWIPTSTTTMQINVLNNGTVSAALNGTSITGNNFEFGGCIYYQI